MPNSDIRIIFGLRYLIMCRLGWMIMESSVDGAHLRDQKVRFNARLFGNFKVFAGLRDAKPSLRPLKRRTEKKHAHRYYKEYQC